MTPAPHAALACAAAFLACAAPRPLEPTSPAHGALVVTVSMEGREAFGASRRWPQEVYLTRVLEGGRLDLERRRAQLKEGEVFAFLDVPPGRYALTGMAYQGRYGLSQLSFDAGASTGAAVRVEPGAVAFAGSVNVALSWAGLRDGPPKQALRREKGDARAEIAALSRLRGLVARTEWEDMLQRRLAALGQPRREVTRGFWRWKRVLPVQQARGFSYVNVLRWRGPFRVAGGLEWRQPKDLARIGAAFLAPGMPGYLPAPQYLAHLRSLGREEDEPLERETVFAGHPAYVRRYTTYVYPAGYEVGSLVKVYFTESLMIPRPDGHLLFHYRAEKQVFERLYHHFRELLAHVDISPPAKGGSS